VRALVAELRKVPGIERQSAVKLVDLAGGGSSRVRSTLAITRPEVVQAYGQWTLGQLLQHFGG